MRVTNRPSWIKEHRAGGDDAIRPAFPATRADLAPFGWLIYRLHQSLIGLRRRHPWLHRARTRVVDLSNTHFIFETFREEHRLIVALNLADARIVKLIPPVRNVAMGKAQVDPDGLSVTKMHLPWQGHLKFVGPDLLVPDPSLTINTHCRRHRQVVAKDRRHVELHRRAKRMECVPLALP
jgi:hypothetical protein